MDEKYKSSGIDVIAWAVIVSNCWLMVFHYLLPLAYQWQILPNLSPLVATTAVFPLHFYEFYLGGHWIAHTSWIFFAVLCGIGLLLRNSAARMTFIVLNIIHIVILAYIVIFNSGHGFLSFLDYFFRLYFNVVVSGVYVGFLTMAEVRQHFALGFDEEKFIQLFVRPHLKEPSLRNAAGYYNLGVAYRRLNRYQESIEALKRAISVKPDDQRFHYELGLTLLQDRKFGLAAHSFQEAVRLDPVCPNGYYSLGVAYTMEGCYKEAVAAFVQASHVSPAQSSVFRDLGKAYFHLQNYPSAAEALRRAVALNPRDADSYLFLGRVYLENEKTWADAREMLMKHVRLEPESKEGFWTLGQVCSKLGRHKDALRSFKEVLRVEPDHRQAHYQLGYTYVMLSDEESARREEKYLREVDADLAQNLAMLMARRS